LSDEQGELLDALFAHNGLSIAEAERMSGRPRRSVQRDFRELADRGLVDLVGQTRSARWVPVRDVIGAKSSEARMP
jgi:predicted transcriptional regulator